MWSLRNSTTQLIHLTPNTTITIGRKDCDLLLSDPSVSKLHAKIRVKSYHDDNFDDDENKKLSSICAIIDEGSTRGTRLIRQKKCLLLSGKCYNLLPNDQIKFGTDNEWTLCYTQLSILTCGDCHDNIKKFAKIIHSIGGKIYHQWNENCEYFTTLCGRVTPRFVTALAAGLRFVTLQYWEDFHRACQSRREFPDPNEYGNIDWKYTYDLKHVSLLPQSRRQHIFDGLEFVFFSYYQIIHFASMIERAGGRPLMYGTYGFNENYMLSEQTIIISCMKGRRTFNECCGIKDDDYQKIRRLLSKKRRKMCHEVEIVKAIMLCSRDKHCNPDLHRQERQNYLDKKLAEVNEKMKLLADKAGVGVESQDHPDVVRHESAGPSDLQPSQLSPHLGHMDSSIKSASDKSIETSTSSDRKRKKSSPDVLSADEELNQSKQTERREPKIIDDKILHTKLIIKSDNNSDANKRSSIDQSKNKKQKNTDSSVPHVNVDTSKIMRIADNSLADDHNEIELSDSPIIISDDEPEAADIDNTIMNENSKDSDSPLNDITIITPPILTLTGKTPRASVLTKEQSNHTYIRVRPFKDMIDRKNDNNNFKQTPEIECVTEMTGATADVTSTAILNSISMSTTKQLRPRKPINYMETPSNDEISDVENHQSSNYNSRTIDEVTLDKHNDNQNKQQTLLTTSNQPTYKPLQDTSRKRDERFSTLFAKQILPKPSINIDKGNVNFGNVQVMKNAVPSVQQSGTNEKVYKQIMQGNNSSSSKMVVQENTQNQNAIPMVFIPNRSNNDDNNKNDDQAKHIEKLNYKEIINIENNQSKQNSDDDFQGFGESVNTPIRSSRELHGETDNNQNLQNKNAAPVTSSVEKHDLINNENALPKFFTNFL